jgi:hypothetical protein
MNSGHGAPIVLRFENWALKPVKIDWVSHDGSLETHGEPARKEIFEKST